MNSTAKLFPALLLLLSTAACHKKTAPVKSEVPASAAAPTSLKIEVMNTEFKTFNAKGRMEMEKPDEKLASNVTLRIKKDSVIWVSVMPALGIEVARLRITPDTIQLLDRLHKEYFAGNFSMLQKRYNISASFQMLQAVLLGNYLPGQAGQEKEIAGSDLQQIRQLRENLTFDQFLNPSQHKLTRIQLSNNTTKDAMKVVYNDFEDLIGKPFATSMLITLDRVSAVNANARNMVISVKYNKYNLNDPGILFPFTIPTDYKRK